MDRDTQEPYLVQATPGQDPTAELDLRRAENPVPNGTLGDIELATDVTGPEEFPLAILIQPVQPGDLVGVDVTSVRAFRWDDGSRTLQPNWHSGINVNLGFIWTKIRRPGTYVPIGVPRDRLLQEALRSMARERRLADVDSPEQMRSLTEPFLRFFSEAPAEAVEELREFVARLEVGTGLRDFLPGEVKLRQGGHVAAFPLPRDATLEEFKERLGELEAPFEGLPEEVLYYPPDALRGSEVPWPLPPERQSWNGIDSRSAEFLRGLSVWRFVDPHPLDVLIRWLFSRDWWMYQHNVRHTGQASGWSDIRSTNAHTMVQQSRVSLDGPVITKPSIVGGKIYVGTGRWRGGPGGTLYKIDLATGAVEGRFGTSGIAYYRWYQGIGGSPAVVGGRVYFTGIHGKVYCVDAATMTGIWETDLSAPGAARKQPVNQPDADSWSGPLVVNGKVYVGCGEGEDPETYGFIYCLDANTGDVVWLFCTSKFTNQLAPGSENQPNVIPASVAVSDPLPGWATAAGFSIQADAPPARETGSAVWSSCAYDEASNRIYVGTGNSEYDPAAPGLEADLPDEWYGSGLISLDADTGEFRGFFQPDPEDSYWPGDFDVDVPGAPTIFTRRGQRLLAFGSKNGSFFLLDPDTLSPIARRQLLPRSGGSGLPGDRGAPIPDVVPTGGSGENRWGVMGTPALHPGLGRLFIGLGGYVGIGAQDKTPFLRALDWDTLQDAWATTVGPDGVARYTTTNPPMYGSDEAGLSSPAVVNDVVFVSTSKPALYALDANRGQCLWSAPNIPAGNPNEPTFALGPAIYGNHVVMGAWNNVYIYRLPAAWLVRR